jgi:hypothetical protein
MEFLHGIPRNVFSNSGMLTYDSRLYDSERYILVRNLSNASITIPSGSVVDFVMIKLSDTN